MKIQFHHPFSEQPFLVIAIKTKKNNTPKKKSSNNIQKNEKYDFQKLTNQQILLQKILLHAI